jgi:CTP-dependent riboflavin kinase
LLAKHHMDKNRIYRGTVKTGRSGAVAEMSKPGDLGGFQRVTGLSVIPGTLNIKLTEPFDSDLLKYLNFADIGWEFDPATQGIKYNGEIGMYYGRVNVAGKYPACLIIFTWVTDPRTDAELISPHHLRTVLNLRDGDTVEFTLDKE